MYWKCATRLSGSRWMTIFRLSFVPHLCKAYFISGVSYLVRCQQYKGDQMPLVCDCYVSSTVLPPPSSHPSSSFWRDSKCITIIIFLSKYRQNSQEYDYTSGNMSEIGKRDEGLEDNSRHCNEITIGDATSDESRLAGMGYKAELKREFGLISLLGFGFSVSF